MRPHFSRSRPALTWSRLCLVVGVALLSLGFSSNANSLPAQGTIDLNAVRIYYDAQMVPHVFGPDDEAALYGLGYHHVLDFPVGTLNLLWLHSARMAELAGSSYLDEDRLLRLWDVPAVAARHEAELQAQGLLPLIDAYVAGIEAGRAWWRDNGPLGLSARFEALLGTDLRVNFDPVPVHLNPLFSPYGEFGDPAVATQIRRVFQRMFDASMPVTREHVLRLGVAVDSKFLYMSNSILRDVMPNSFAHPPTPAGPQIFDPAVDTDDLSAWYPSSTGSTFGASNSWLVASDQVQAGGVVTLCDNHVAFNTLNVRPYLAQVSGGTYQVAGLTMPGYPGIYQGYNDWISWAVTAFASPPVSDNLWEASLLPSLDPSDLRFLFEVNGTSTAVELETVVEAIPWYDPNTQQTFLYQDRREYVPVQAAEGSGLVFTRYPVLPDDGVPPLPGETITFGQHIFSAERSPWEFCLRLGRARNATSDLDAVLGDVRMLYGPGRNLVVADRDQNFRYLYMTRCPIQGDEVPPESYLPGALLDGSRLGMRWQGYHALAELPSMVANVAGTNETWIQNNVSPDVVDEEQRIPDLTVFPAYMVAHETLSTFRQLRAAELLRGPDPLTNAALEDCAGDQTDLWTRALWPVYQEAAGLTSLSQRAQDMLAWVDEHRHDDEQDVPVPSYDFVAHVFSQVTVYTTLLRSHYRDHLATLNEEDLQNGGPGLTPEQLRLGLDPLHPVLADPSELGSGAYGPNLLAFAHALETVSDLWQKGSGPQGLQNQSVITTLDKRLGLGHWDDPLYSSPLEPPWSDVIEGERVTRWGHVQVFAPTPHALGTPKRKRIEAFALLGEDPLLILRGYLYAALYTSPYWWAGRTARAPQDPGLVPGLPRRLEYATLRDPFLSHQVSAWPIGGTDESLWQNQNLALYSKDRPRDYQEGVYRWNGDDHLFFSPKTSASIVTFAANLPPSGTAARAQGRFLASLGGTEITRPNLLQDGALVYQRRLAPCEDFAQRRWRTLVSNEALLGLPRYVFEAP